jgi:toxin ParE1/3/4
MSGFKFSPNARAALQIALNNSLLNFGRPQTDRYIVGFQRTFELLAQFPGVGRPADHFRRGLRCYRYESNYIFFTVEDDYILIREIFHTSQNITKKMFR